MRKQVDNLQEFVTKYRTEFDLKLDLYDSTGLMNWEDSSWRTGDKGVAWLRQAKAATIVFGRTKIKGVENIDIEDNYGQFMRAVIFMDTFRRSKIPSASTSEKISNVMRRWYYEMVKTTGQTHPMYLSSDIIHAAMKRHFENSSSPNNVSDYCDIAVSISKLIKPLNLTLSNIESMNQFPMRGSTSNTKARNIAEMIPDRTDDEKLITISTFMSIIELMYLAKADGEKIILNALFLLIITGLRFQELQSIKIDALIKRHLTDDKLQHARENGLSEYYLGIKYLGAKKSGWRTFWAAPSTNILIESIFSAVEKLTANSRERVKQYRKSDFTDFLPSSIRELPYELIEVSELYDHVFTGTGGTRGNAGLRRSIVTAFSQKGVGILPKVEEINPTLKRFMYTKQQINDFVELKYIQSKGFHDGYKCTLVNKDDGIEQKFNYEDLLFILPTGSLNTTKTLITLTNPEPLVHSAFQAWLGGNSKRLSIFDKLGLTEEDGGRIEINPHVPRHNINTFLAMAGVTDHLQAMLMGRIDITQNQFYQHQAESHSYQATSLAAMVMKKYEEPEEPAAFEQKQFGLLEDNSYSHASKAVQTINCSMSRHINALAKSSKYKPAHSGVDAVKRSGSIIVTPGLSMEDNLKINMHTVGESNAEVTKHIENTMSESFLPDLKLAHDRLLRTKSSEMAKDLIKRHAHLHSMKIGSCIRDVARWGCPFAMKCQSGEPCGYFTLTGRLDELEAVTNKLLAKKSQVKKLKALYEKDKAYKLSYKEQLEALIMLEAFQSKVIVSMKDKKLVSLLSTDKENPLGKIISRITEQSLIGKSPRTLADLFYIEQKRLERD
ncbi:hypothetical protein [Oceanisphaera sp. IT1-181]|uniref:hypothetical protein n=1 Tax=Oceanisphaera sp. IT1-181 TaxID=3081199 RepID=UPI0029CA93CF|nr:hypothetical protein [Oceanisphaera sp. IT1-181]